MLSLADRLACVGIIDLGAGSLLVNVLGLWEVHDERRARAADRGGVLIVAPNAALMAIRVPFMPSRRA